MQNIADDGGGVEYDPEMVPMGYGPVIIPMGYGPVAKGLGMASICYGPIAIPGG